MAKLFPQQVVFGFIDLKTNLPSLQLITASNVFMFEMKVERFYNENEIHIESWSLENQKWSCGNKGLNAGPYFWETLEELKSL